MNSTVGLVDGTLQYIYHEVMEHYMPAYFKDFQYTPWVFSLLGSALIGLSGILPLFIIPIDTGTKDTQTNRKFNFIIYLNSTL